MNRTLKDATVKRYHYDTHDQLRVHLQLFVDASNHARRLKTLRGLTPYEFVFQIWTKEPDRFRLDPSHHIPGPYTAASPPGSKRQPETIWPSSPSPPSSYGGDKCPQNLTPGAIWTG